MDAPKRLKAIANSLTSLMGRSSSFSKNQLRFKQPYQTASHSRSRGREANQSRQQVSRLLGAGSFSHSKSENSVKLWSKRNIFPATKSHQNSRFQTFVRFIIWVQKYHLEHCKLIELRPTSGWQPLFFVRMKVDDQRQTFLEKHSWKEQHLAMKSF